MSSAQAPVLRCGLPLVHLWTVAGICSDLSPCVVNGTMCNFSPRTGTAPQGQRSLEQDGTGEPKGSLLCPMLGLETVKLTQSPTSGYVRWPLGTPVTQALLYLDVCAAGSTLHR